MADDDAFDGDDDGPDALLPPGADDTIADDTNDAIETRLLNVNEVDPDGHIDHLLGIWYRLHREDMVTDVLNEFGNAQRFVVDGEALACFALQDALGPKDDAPSTLAVVFAVERFLEELRARCGQFDLVFAADYDELLWAHQPLPARVARAAILAHLTAHLPTTRLRATADAPPPPSGSTDGATQPCRVFVLEQCWSAPGALQQWAAFLHGQRFSFVLTDDRWLAKARPGAAQLAATPLPIVVAITTALATVDVVLFRDLRLSSSSFNAWVCTINRLDADELAGFASFCSGVALSSIVRHQAAPVGVMDTDADPGDAGHFDDVAVAVRAQRHILAAGSDSHTAATHARYAAQSPGLGAENEALRPIVADLVHLWLAVRALQRTVPLTDRQIVFTVGQPAAAWAHACAAIPALNLAGAFLLDIQQQAVAVLLASGGRAADAADAIDGRLFFFVLLAYFGGDDGNDANALLPETAAAVFAGLLVRAHAAPAAQPATPEGRAAAIAVLAHWAEAARTEAADRAEAARLVLQVRSDDVAAITGMAVAAAAAGETEGGPALDGGLLRREHHWHSPKLLESDGFRQELRERLQSADQPQRAANYRVDWANRSKHRAAAAQSRTNHSLFAQSAWKRPVHIVSTASKSAEGVAASTASAALSGKAAAIVDQNNERQQATAAAGLRERIDKLLPTKFLEDLTASPTRDKDKDQLKLMATAIEAAVEAKCFSEATTGQRRLIEYWLRQVDREAGAIEKLGLVPGQAALPTPLLDSLSVTFVLVKTVLSWAYGLFGPPPAAGPGDAAGSASTGASSSSAAPATVAKKGKAKPGTNASVKKVADAAKRQDAPVDHATWLKKVEGWQPAADRAALLKLVRRLGWPDLTDAAARLLATAAVPSSTSSSSASSSTSSSRRAPWTAFPGMATAVQFQLEHSPKDLTRQVGSVDDRRVMFRPDAWQVTLLDAVDARRSVIVVAPTSAGKTFISFYAMERVLRESDTGVLVYVAPTKELALQTLAEVQVRFSKATTHGRGFAGIFTREFRDNESDCQILVTVPQCLDILLLSTAHAANGWRGRLRSVIFDEVHNVTLNDGAVWEQLLLTVGCPFLALSATIGDADRFGQWLRKVDQRRVDLLPAAERAGRELVQVTWNQRYNDLALHTFVPATPFTTATTQRVDPLWAWVSTYSRTLSSEVPTDLRLLPEDCAQLYRQIVHGTAGGDALAPDAFLGSLNTNAPWNLSMNDVRTYEEELKRVVGARMAADPATEAAVVAYVAPTASAIQRGARGVMGITGYIKKHLPGLVDALDTRDKLPAVLFYLDRHGCEQSAQLLYEHLHRKELQSQNGPEAARLATLEQQLMSAEQTLQRQRASAGENPPPSVANMIADKQANVNSLQGQASTLRERLFRANAYVPIGVSLPTKEEISAVMRGEANWADPLHIALLYGIGVHHAGLQKRYRQAVVELFRSRKLGVILATATLAQGIHMPCRTVAFLGSSPYLNAVTFRQMSGRAGRRGFDLRGDVVLFGFQQDEVQKILSAELPLLRPNRPLRPSLALRVVMQLFLIRERERACQETQRTAEARELAAAAATCIAAARRLLADGIDSIPHSGASSSTAAATGAAGPLLSNEARVAQQNSLTFRFILDSFRHMGVVDHAGRPSQMSSLVAHLHFLEPANLALVHLLRDGALEYLTAPVPQHLRRRQTELQDQCDSLVAVLSYLLRPRPVSARALWAFSALPVEARPFRSVILPPLPDHVRASLDAWNRRQLAVAVAYYTDYCRANVAGLGTDCRLPFTYAAWPTAAQAGAATVMPSRWAQAQAACARAVHLRSAFVGLADHGDGAFASLDELVASRRTGLWLDPECVPVVNLPEPWPVSADMYHFFRRGAAREVETAYGLKANEVYEATNDFSLALQAVWGALKRMALDAATERDAGAAIVAGTTPDPAGAVPFSDTLVALVESSAITMMGRLNQLRSRAV